MNFVDFAVSSYHDAANQEFVSGTEPMTDGHYSQEFQRTLGESAWLLRTNQPAAALDKLLTLYEQAPTNLDVLINLGGAYILLRKWSKAAQTLSRAAELFPENAMVWMNLAAAHLGQLELSSHNNQMRALKAYQRVLELDPQAPNVHYHMGLIHKERRAWEAAEHFFREALRVDSHDRDAMHWLEQLPALRAAAEAHAAAADEVEDARTDGAGA